MERWYTLTVQTTKGRTLGVAIKDTLETPVTELEAREAAAAMYIPAERRVS